VRRCRRACAASDRLTPENTSQPILNTWLVFSGVSRSHGPAHGRAGIGRGAVTGNEPPLPPLLRVSELKLVPFSPYPPRLVVRFGAFRAPMGLVLIAHVASAIPH